VTMQVETESREPVLAAPDPVPAPNVNVVTIPRVLVNYGIIAVSCFVVGLVVGVFAYDRIAQNNRVENSELINSAVAAAVAALPDSAAADPTPDPNRRYDVTDAGNPSMGPADAPVTIIEFADFNCGYCKSFFEQTLHPLLDAYEGQVRFVFRDYPILGAASVQASLAAECADDQGQFWAFHDRVYSEQNLTRDNFLLYATDLGLDVDTFTTCLDEATHQDEIESDYRAGVDLGVGGTPTFFINGKILVGAQPYASFAAVVESELNSAAADVPSDS
jgi:protein-disulfide isomerase